MKRRYIYGCIIALGVIALGLGLSSSELRAKFHFIGDIPAPDTKPHLEVYLNGKNFTPNQNYLLGLKNGDYLSISSNNDGEIKGAYVLPSKLGADKNLFFTFAQDNPTVLDNPTLEISIDTEKNDLNWNGQFYLPSEEVKFSISNNGTRLKSHTVSDWSGNFRQNISYTGINLIEEEICIYADQSKQELCLSFGIRHAPELIEVLIYPDSVDNNPSDDPFSPFDNWTRPTNCTPELTASPHGISLCDEDHVFRLQDMLSRTYYDFTRMTLQLSAGMMQQVGFIGTLFDAKHQLETQLLLWEKQERAHEDYHPSEQMCYLASMTKDLAASEMKRDINVWGLTRAFSFDEQNMVNTASERGTEENSSLRIMNFKTNHCAPSNFANSLRAFCDDFNAGNFARLNRDIDYTSLISVPKTLDIDITDGVNSSADEQDAMSMGHLLFGHKAMTFPVANTGDPKIEARYRKIVNDTEGYARLYQEHRSISAVRNVARHSYTNMLGMKSSGTGFTRTHITTLLQEFGMSEDDVNRFVGENPSYFAQMDVLTKKIYQHPNFYTNLITKEANITRFEATMEAMRLMSNRDRYEAILRKEMLLSLLVEMKIRSLQKDVNVGLESMGARSWPR